MTFSSVIYCPTETFLNMERQKSLFYYLSVCLHNKSDSVSQCIKNVAVMGQIELFNSLISPPKIA